MTGNTVGMFLHNCYRANYKAFKKIGRPITDLYTNRASNYATANEQEYINPFICDKDDLIKCMNNVNVAVSNSYLISGGTNNTNQAGEFYLEVIEGQFTIMNPTNFPVEVTLYDCMAKHLVSSGALTTYPRDCVQYGIGGQDMTISGTGIPGTTTYRSLGITPYDSDLFNTFWNVKRKSVFTLPSGKAHIHRFRINVNRIIKNVLLQNLYLTVPTLTYSPLIIFKGLPGSVSNGTSAVFGITESSLEVYTEYQFRYTAISNNAVYTNDYTADTKYTNSAMWNTANGSIETFKTLGNLTGYTDKDQIAPAANISESLAIIAEDVQKLVYVQGKTPAVVVDGSGNSLVNPSTGLPWDATV